MFARRLNKMLLAANGTITFPADVIPDDKPQKKKPSDANKRYADAGGAFNCIFFGILDNVKFSTQDEKEDMPGDIVISLPRVGASPQGLNFQRFFAAQRLLRQYKVPIDFNMAFLYYDGYGRRIALRGRDFYEYSHHNKLPFSDVLNLMRDAALGLYDLHSRNLVHRDIKAENLLLFGMGKHRHLKIIDHDSLRLVDPEDGNRLIGKPDISGTAAFYPPGAPLDDLEIVPKLDLKAVDLYTLGILFYREMVNLLEEPKDREKIRAAFGYLLSKEPMERGSIEDVLDNKIFGKAQESAEQFHLRRTLAQKQVYVDGHPFRRVGVNNPFYLLNAAIKPIYVAANMLQKAMTRMEAMPEPNNEKAVQDELAKLKQMVTDSEPNLYVEDLQEAAERDAREMKVSTVILQKTAHEVLKQIKEESKVDTLRLFSECKSTAALEAAKNMCRSLRKKLQPGKYLQELLLAKDKSNEMEKFRKILKLHLSRLPDNLLRELSLRDHVKDTLPNIFAHKKVS